MRLLSNGAANETATYISRQLSHRHVFHISLKLRPKPRRVFRGAGGEWGEEIWVLRSGNRLIRWFLAYYPSTDEPADTVMHSTDIHMSPKLGVIDRLRSIRTLKAFRPSLSFQRPDGLLLLQWLGCFTSPRCWNRLMILCANPWRPARLVCRRFERHSSLRCNLFHLLASTFLCKHRGVATQKEGEV